MSDQLEVNKALVRRLYERLMANGDVGAAEEILDERYVDHSLPGNAEGGRAELLGVVQAVRAAIPNIAPTVDQAVAEDDLVAIRITARGRHTDAPFPPGIPAAGTAIEWREQHIFRIADGRIVEHWGVFDNLAILQQLGAVPRPRDLDRKGSIPPNRGAGQHPGP